MPANEYTFRCPWCLETSDVASLMAIATSRALDEDPVLGAEPLRFLPSRFDADGHPIDPEGQPCHWLACPRCRSPLPLEGVGLESIDVHASPESVQALRQAATDPANGSWLAVGRDGFPSNVEAVTVAGRRLARIVSQDDPADGDVEYVPRERPILVPR